MLNSYRINNVNATINHTNLRWSTYLECTHVYTHTSIHIHTSARAAACMDTCTEVRNSLRLTKDLVAVRLLPLPANQCSHFTCACQGSESQNIWLHRKFMSDFVNIWARGATSFLLWFHIMYQMPLFRALTWCMHHTSIYLFISPLLLSPSFHVEHVLLYANSLYCRYSTLAPSLLSSICFVHWIDLRGGYKLCVTLLVPWTLRMQLHLCRNKSRSSCMCERERKRRDAHRTTLKFQFIMIMTPNFCIRTYARTHPCIFMHVHVATHIHVS